MGEDEIELRIEAFDDANGGGVGWSHRRKWEDIDDMGGCVLPLDQALNHVASNSLFWTWT